MRFKRRQHYIDSHVQGSLLRRIFIHWITFFGVACLSVVVLKTLLGDPSEPIMQRMVSESSEFIFLGVILISLFPAFMLDTIRFSNRFVGPIARLRRVLRELGNNDDVTVVKFRESDFWADVANDFNKAAALCKQQREEIAELKGQLKKETAVS